MEKGKEILSRFSERHCRVTLYTGESFDVDFIVQEVQYHTHKQIPLHVNLHYWIFYKIMEEHIGESITGEGRYAVKKKDFGTGRMFL